MKITNFYKDGSLFKISPWIEEIILDVHGRPALIKCQNGVRVIKKYDFKGRIVFEGISLIERSPKITKYTYARSGKLVNIKSTILKNATFSYDNNQQLMVFTSENNQQETRNEGNLIEFNNLRFEYANGELTNSINTPEGVHITLFRGFGDEFLGACAVQENSVKTIIKLSPDEFLIDNIYTRAIRYNGQILGVIHSGSFYPAILDHRGSLVGLISEDGKDIAFIRHFSLWGELLKVDGDQALVENIPWSFGHLIELPLSSGNVLMSSTRVYVPTLGEWAPEKLVNQPGNWYPYRYASNDSVNFVDPSGIVLLHLLIRS